MRKILSLTILLFSICFSNAQSIKKTIINGVVKDSSITSILLLKSGGDLRNDAIEIPVVDMVFNHVLELEHPEYFTLFLGRALRNAGGRYMHFFVEGGQVNLTIYLEEDFDKNIVKGGALNMAYKEVQKTIEREFYDRNKPISDSIDVMYKNRTFFSDAMKALNTKLRSAKTQDEKIDIYRERDELEKAGLHLSEAAKPLYTKQLKIFDELNSWKEKYIAANGSLVGYYFLVEDLLYDRERKKSYNQYEGYYQKYSTIFPGHPYNEKVKNLLESYKINKGGRFVDFTNPDLNGKLYTLSNEIKGKVAVIDLWATWCGPCIAKSRRLVPVYNSYKDKGFTVVGVAGEFKSTDRLKSFLEKEKYPWLNLVELDKYNNIWDKYGVSNSGGGIFLVDKEGTVLAVNPSAKEIESKLKEILD